MPPLSSLNLNTLERKALQIQVSLKEKKFKGASVQDHYNLAGTFLYSIIY